MYTYIIHINIHEIINETIELIGINIVNMHLNIYVRSISIIVGKKQDLNRLILNAISLYMEM